MKTLWNQTDRDELKRRVRALTPERVPSWGRMNAPEMMAHVSDQLRMTLGRLHPAKIGGVTQYWPVKQLFIYVLPWPKGAPTIPELRTRPPAAWGTEIADFVQLIDDFGKRDPAEPWPEHPLFARLSSRAWGALGYRHVNHHFTQFGV